jgi:hypothetical protein
MNGTVEVTSEQVIEQVKLELDQLSANTKFQLISSNLSSLFWALEGADVDWAAAGCGVGGGTDNVDNFELAISELIKNNKLLGSEFVGDDEGSLGPGDGLFKECADKFEEASTALDNLNTAQAKYLKQISLVGIFEGQKLNAQETIETLKEKNRKQRVIEAQVSDTLSEIFMEAESNLNDAGIAMPWKKDDVAVSTYTNIWDPTNKITGPLGLLNPTQSILLDQLSDYIAALSIPPANDLPNRFQKAQAGAIEVKAKLNANNQTISSLNNSVDAINIQLVTENKEQKTLEDERDDKVKDLGEAILELAGCIPAILTDAALIAAVSGLVVISICYIARTFAPSNAVTEGSPNLGNSALVQTSAIVSQWRLILAGLYARAETISSRLMKAVEDGNNGKIKNLTDMGDAIGDRITSLEAQIAAVNPSQHAVNGEYSKIYRSKMLVPESIKQVKSDAWKKWRMVGEPGSDERKERIANNPFRAVEYVIKYKEHVSQEIWGWPGQDSYTVPSPVKFDNLPEITLPPPAGRVPGFKPYTLCNNGLIVEVVLNQEGFESMTNAGWVPTAVDGKCPQPTGFVCDGVSGGCRPAQMGEPNGSFDELTECEDDCKCVKPGGGGGGGGGGKKHSCGGTRACGRGGFGY